MPCLEVGMTGSVIRRIKGRAGRTPLPFAINPEETLRNRYQACSIVDAPTTYASYPDVARLCR